MLLAELAAVAAESGIDLSVGYLYGRRGAPLADRLRAAGARPVNAGAHRMASVGALIGVRRQIAATRPDVVHTHLLHADILGGLAARSLGVPWVSTAHAATWDGTTRERVRAGLAFALRRRYARRVIAVSNNARDAYLAHSGIDPERVVVLPNGISTSPSPGAGRRIRAELGLDPASRVVLISGPLRREKGHARALMALGQLRDQEPALRVLLLGDGPDTDEVLERARALDGTVSVLGYRDDVMAVLDAADAMLHTPETDALPNGLIEAAAAGVPVVATATGGIPEIVEAGKTGVLVPADAGPDEISQALASLLADVEARRSLGAEARQRFQRRFSPDRWAAGLRAIYEAVLNER